MWFSLAVQLTKYCVNVLGPTFDAIVSISFNLTVLKEEELFMSLTEAVTQKALSRLLRREKGLGML